MARTLTSCLADGCNRIAGVPGSGRGYCPKHYLRLRRHGDPHASKINREQTGKLCGVDGCESPSGYYGYCLKHGRRWKLYGDPEAFSARYRRVHKWLEDHATYKGDGCLKWPFSVGDHGRGAVVMNGNGMSAPRAMCTLAHGGPPTSEHEAAHSCGKGHEGCVNPNHLRWATASENRMDMIDHGTFRRGEKVNTAKLTADQVREIRHIGRSQSGRSLAQRFDVSPAAISAILTRRAWAWLD